MEYKLGDIVSVLDSVDLETKIYATVAYIEVDFNNMIWLYLIAINHDYNNEFDPKVGSFWRIIEVDNEYLSFEHPAF